MPTSNPIEGAIEAPSLPNPISIPIILSIGILISNAPPSEGSVDNPPPPEIPPYNPQHLF